MGRLFEKYKAEIVDALREQFKYKSSMAVPKLEKIVVSMGIGRAVLDGPKDAAKNRRLKAAMTELAQITGQQPVPMKAKKSVSNFKVREGWDVGMKVTLRGKRMFEFLDRLISIAIPRVRDFQGLSSNGFDGRGNYNMGLSEQTIFPEVNIDKVEFQQGMNIAFVTTAGSDEEGAALLRMLGLPLRTAEQEALVIIA
ncbi:MAG: 50S ribosomal protein L5 [Hyphomicrobiaceae bacterium]|nr:50S ribosomal protein L5 [Hyphomicrobiaceae bacterium]